MATAFDLDELINRFTWTTEALLQAVQNPSFESVSSLLDERAGQLALLKRYSAESSLSRTQLERLERVADLGGETHKPIAIKREVLRARMNELRSTRGVHKALQPYRPTVGRRLNVQL